MSEQRQLVLTAHPLQRVGAFVIAALAGQQRPEQVSSEQFEAVVGGLTDDAVTAALVPDSKKPEGFWLKQSMSLFPNSKMNHPSNGRRDDDEIKMLVRQWRQAPDLGGAPGVSCVLCSRAAVGFFGKADVPLAESSAYRNTTPRGHEGMALCWPCLCSFYALPYGCQLTGGPAIAVHSWDEAFLYRAVAVQVSRTAATIRLQADDAAGSLDRYVVALRALRAYDRRVRAGVEVLVFNNNNRGQTFDSYVMEQPLAEWLRRMPQRGFGALVRVHHSEKVPGETNLARNAFRDPSRVLLRCVRSVTGAAAERGVIGSDTAVLAGVCSSFVSEVVGVDERDLGEVKATAVRLAMVLGRHETGGKLREFYAKSRSQKELRAWLQRQAVDWTVNPPEGVNGPLVSTRGFDLLFDPGVDSLAWYHRQVLLVAVLEELHKRGWRAVDGPQVIQDLDEVDQAGAGGPVEDEESQR